MNSRSLIAALVAGITSCAIAPQATAAAIVANKILAYYNSGAGTMKNPYGGTSPESPPGVAVWRGNATDGNGSTFVSLYTGSSLTLGFSTPTGGLGSLPSDGSPEPDLFVSEVGAWDEKADVSISWDFGDTFAYLGVAMAGTVTPFNFDGLTTFINAVRVVGLDNGGPSPGFDLAFVKGRENGTVVIPEPATMALFSLGLLGIAASARRRKS